MISHRELGELSFAGRRLLASLINNGDIGLAGNKNGKIFGLLSCSRGKRMHSKNRVFFKDLAEALAAGYRPCGFCMRGYYKAWRKSYG